MAFAVFLGHEGRYLRDHLFSFTGVPSAMIFPWSDCDPVQFSAFHIVGRHEHGDLLALPSVLMNSQIVFRSGVEAERGFVGGTGRGDSAESPRASRPPFHPSEKFLMRSFFLPVSPPRRAFVDPLP